MLAQVLRIEGTLNEKYSPPRLVARVPDACTGLRYNPSDFEEFVAPEDGTPSAARPTIHVELPRDAPSHIARAVELLGVKTREVRKTGRLIALLLYACPACGGLERKGKIARWTAHVGPLSGKLRCKRQSCDAREPDGLALDVWVGRFLPGYLEEVYALVPVHDRHSLPALLPDGAERVLMIDAGAALVRMVEEAALWARETKGIAVIALIPGVGKTAVVLLYMLLHVRTAFLGPNHVLLYEKLREYGGAATHFKGVGAGCLHAGARFAKDTIGFYTWRYKVCGECELREECPAWVDIRADVPVFAAHVADEQIEAEFRDCTIARSPEEIEDDVRSRVVELIEQGRSADADSIRAEIPITRELPGRLAFYDEMPALLEELEFSAIELGHVLTGNVLWRSVRVGAVEFSADEYRESIARGIEVLLQMARALRDEQ